MVSGEKTDGHGQAPKIQFCSEKQHCREALEDSPCFICLIYMLASDPQQQNGILELKKSHINKGGEG